MQADLGGAFYEMAIRDHVRMDVLTRKAAELQRVDAELLAVERMLELERADAAGLCPSCGAPYGHAVRFCAQCGHVAGADRGGRVKALTGAVPPRDRRRGDADRQALRPARRLLAGRDLGDRRRAMTSTGGSGAAGGAARPQPRRRQHSGRERRRPPDPSRAPSRPAGQLRAARARPAPPAGGPLASPAPAPRRKRAARAERRSTTSAADRAGDRRPKRAGSSTSSSSRSPAPATKPPSAPTSQMPYLAATLRPQGELLTGYSLLDNAALPNEIAAISGQPPNAATKADCPTYDEFPPTALDSKGVVAGSGCVYPVETLTLADQLGLGRFTWRAYIEGWPTKPASPTTASTPTRRGRRSRLPGGYAARAQPVRLLPLAARPRRLRDQRRAADRTEQGPEEGRRDANYSYIAPNLCNAGVAGQCPAGAPDGAAAADAFLAEWVPKILASPAYKKDGLLIVTFGAVEPGRDRGRAGARAADPLKVGRAAGLAASSPPARPTPTPTTPTRCCARPRTSSASPTWRRPDGAKVKSFAPAAAGRQTAATEACGETPARRVSGRLGAWQDPSQSGEPITAAGHRGAESRARAARRPGAPGDGGADQGRAREGDLKENAEYHVAKEDQAHLETRIKRLQERLHNAVVVEVDARRRRLRLRPHRRGPRRGQRRDQRLDPGRLDRGRPRRGPPLGRVADRAGPDGRARSARRSRSRRRKASAPSRS